LITATIESGQAAQVGSVIGMVVVNIYSAVPIVVSVGGTVLGTVVGTVVARLLAPGTVVVSDPVALRIAAIESILRMSLGAGESAR
jgi:hypothetical protein